MRRSSSSAVDVRKITDQVNNRRAARYVLSEMRALAQQDGFRLVLAMDGVRNAIYAGKGLESYEVGKLNRLVGEVASELDIPLLDLHATFAGHYLAIGNASSCLRLALERSGEPSRR